MSSVTTSIVPLSCEQRIQGRHHERLAIVYVRQSTVQQVQHHQESTQVRYGLVHLAKRLANLPDTPVNELDKWLPDRWQITSADPPTEQSRSSD